MWHRRILYALALISAALFQIFYDRYLARYVLACVVSLPILSLLLAIPAALRLRLRLEGSGTECRRGTTSQWRICVERRTFLPVSRLTVRFRFTNDLTGWTEKKRVRFDRLSAEKQAFPIQAEHCGRVTCRVTRVRMLDSLGLFALPVRRPAPAAVLVLPVRARLEELPSMEMPNMSTAVEGKQKVPNGDYELRDYRPGDPLRSVHWKLSSKRDELVVREWQGSTAARVILAVDRFGDPERLDRVLDRFYSLSMSLLEKDYPHLAQWEEQGAVRTASIPDRETLLACMGEMLSRRAPLEGRAMRELLPPDGNIPTVFVTDGEEETP